MVKILTKGSMSIRIGQGFDAHKFVKGRPFIMGGVKIPFEYGLEGHSDADALTHAIIDSLLGALALGNIGERFPDTDQKLKNIDSMLLLKDVLNDPEVKKWKLVNLDATIIAQKPKLSEHAKTMGTSLAKALNTAPENISIKAKTTEGMGFCGREEGVAVFVNILISNV